MQTTPTMSSSDLRRPPLDSICAQFHQQQQSNSGVFVTPYHESWWPEKPLSSGGFQRRKKSLFVNYSIKFSTLFAPTQSSYHPQLLMFCVWRFIQQMIIIRLMDQRISDGVTPSSSDTGDKWRMLVGWFLLLILLCSPLRTIHGRNCFRNGTNLPKNNLSTHRNLGLPPPGESLSGGEDGVEFKLNSLFSPQQNTRIADE